MTSADDVFNQLRRGTVDLIADHELQKKLARGKPLRVKAGFDPTAPDLHLGHVVLLEKLRQFQALGHDIYFLIGDFTAKIGDPSGRSATRPPLTDRDIAANVKTYTDQAFHVLDKQKTKIVYNAQWLSKLGTHGLIQLAAQYNVARMLERDDFKKRFQSGQSISVHEFLYPLLQGQDSVEIEADVELGGTDQIFNLLVGRMLQERAGKEPQVVLTMPLLVGLDGEKKMSKSYNNHIAIQDAPGEMFGKLMSVSDTLMWQYYELLSVHDAAEIEQRKAGHPKEAKVALATELVTRFHSAEAAVAAAAEFEKVFANKGKPADIPTETLCKADEGYLLVDVLAQASLTKSKGEARRLMAQRGVRVNDVVITEIDYRLEGVGEYLLQVGKRRFHKVTIK